MKNQREMLWLSVGAATLLHFLAFMGPSVVNNDLPTTKLQRVTFVQVDYRGPKVAAKKSLEPVPRKNPVTDTIIKDPLVKKSPSKVTSRPNAETLPTANGDEPTKLAAESVGPDSAGSADSADSAGSLGAGRPDSGSKAPKLLLETMDIPEYTEAALDADLEGVAVVDVLVNSLGAVVEVELPEKLGYGMDRRIVKAASNVRFSPATDQSGNPVDSWTSIRFNLRIP